MSRTVSRAVLAVMRQLGLYNHDTGRWELFQPAQPVQQIVLTRIGDDWLDVSLEIHKVFKENGINYATIAPGLDGSLTINGISFNDRAVLLDYAV